MEIQQKVNFDIYEGNIAIIDVDLLDNGTRHPNLALMKISGYFKNRGCEVNLIKNYEELTYDNYEGVKMYDAIYASKVFNFSKFDTKLLDFENVYVGGTGFFYDGGDDLPFEIEHHMPDYTLYDEYIEKDENHKNKEIYYKDYLYYSIGFSTRGCFRQCDFCVNKKYNKVFKHSPIKEFLDESRPYLYLWDDNFLAYPNWEEILDEIEATGKPFQFRQGLDLRLMTDRKAQRFNNANYHGDFIFAFDHLEDRDKIIDKIQLWKRYSSKICKLYVLCGFESQDEKDIERTFERIKILMKYGCLPYIMRYEDYKKSKYKGMYIELARWCNQPQFYKKKSFREFCIANQEYKKDKTKNCSSYQAMLDFENDFPEIAAKYFDLKFEEENIYKKQYGYGRKYENKPLCKECKKKQNCWDDIIELKGNEDMEKKFIELYFNKEIDTLCVHYKNSECTVCTQEIAKYIIYILLKYEKSDLIEILKCSKDSYIEDVTRQNIPQVKQLNVVKEVVEILMTNENIDFLELGTKLNSKFNFVNKKELSLKLCGQNYSKLAALLDLVVINKVGHNSNIELSDLGMEFYKLSEVEEDQIVQKLLLRIPVIRNCAINDFDYTVLENDLNVLPVSAPKIKKYNIKYMTDILKK